MRFKRAVNILTKTKCVESLTNCSLSLIYRNANADKCPRTSRDAQKSEKQDSRNRTRKRRRFRNEIPRDGQSRSGRTRRIIPLMRVCARANRQECGFTLVCSPFTYVHRRRASTTTRVGVSRKIRHTMSTSTDIWVNR